MFLGQHDNIKYRYPYRGKYWVYADELERENISTLHVNSVFRVNATVWASDFVLATVNPSNDRSVSVTNGSMKVNERSESAFTEESLRSKEQSNH